MSGAGGVDASGFFFGDDSASERFYSENPSLWRP